MIEEIKRLEGEADFEFKKRLCLLKLNKDIDLDWQEIADVLEIDVSADHLRKLSYAYKEYDEYLNSNGVATRILSISDTHVPFQLPIDTFKDYVGKVDILQLNGDILDCQSISKFSKLYRISIMEELIEGRQYIIDLINYIKPKKVVLNYGNHEMRLGAYLAKNLDSDALGLMPNTALDLIIDGFHNYDKRNKCKTYYEPLANVFNDVEIDYTENWHCQIGETIFCHPQAFVSQPMKTAEKAMTWFRNEGYMFTSLVMAHTHRTGEYTIGNTVTYEQGAGCDTKKNNYSDGKLYNSQKEGFIYICQDSNGKLIKDKTKLVVLN